MDILRNQIIERKTIDLVLQHAKFKDVPISRNRWKRKLSMKQRAVARTPKKIFRKPKMPERPSLYSNRRSVYKILPDRSFQAMIASDCDLNFR